MCASLSETVVCDECHGEGIVCTMAEDTFDGPLKAEDRDSAATGGPLQSQCDECAGSGLITKEFAEWKAAVAVLTQDVDTYREAIVWTPIVCALGVGMKYSFEPAAVVIFV